MTKVVHVFPNSLVAFPKLNESFAVDKSVNKDNVDQKIDALSNEINQTLEDLKANKDQYISDQLDSNTLKNEAAKLVSLHTQLIYYKNFKNN